MNNKPIIPCQVKSSVLAGTSFEEVAKKAHDLLGAIEKKTKRQPYIRSAYFKKEKVFLNYFWPHFMQKPKRERIDRLKLLPCAIEIIEHCQNRPLIKINPNNKQETFYRFVALTRDKELFYVQIKQNTKTKKKYFMSAFYEY